jgi:hypothetical protein
MKIQLFHDYRGVLTGERYYVAGEYSIPGTMLEMDAKALVAGGHAEYVDEPEPVQPTPKRGKR